MASGDVHDVVASGGGFVHGFTFSHSPGGAAFGLAVLKKLMAGDLVATAAVQGEKLANQLDTAIGGHPAVGDIRGKGLLIGIEFVADRATKAPFPREHRFVERLAAAALEQGLLVYPSSGCADGVAGDSILLGPPFVITDDEIETLVGRLQTALARATA
jgi:adenosylmethionine-8-amino-7-oxononanoate aminotransferase